MNPQPRKAASPQSLLVVRPSLAEGGADRVTLTLLQHLDRGLFTPTLALQRMEGPHLADLPDDLRLVHLRDHTLWTAWLPLFGLLRRERPDILFSTSSGMNIAAGLAHLLAGLLSRYRGRLVLSERGRLRTHQGLKKRLLARAKRIIYRHADLVTTVSEGVGQELTVRLAVEPDRLCVVYSPLVDEQMLAQADAETVHPWFEADHPLILAVGRLVEEKDFATLLRAFARIQRSTDARLVILGEGPERQPLERLASDLGINDRVDLPGFDKNPFRYMRRCSVFVLSSRTEGLPGVLIQAMACGAPVVSTDCPSGPAEIIENGQSGLLVPVGDDRQLAAAVVRLLEDPARRTDLAHEGKNAAQRFHVEKVVPLYEQALLGDRVGPR